MRKRIFTVTLCFMLALLIVPLFAFAEETNITDATEVTEFTETTETTEPVQTPLEIIKQPSDARGRVGDKVAVSVKASGDALQYAWYIKTSANAEFAITTVTDSTYSIALPDAAYRAELYCVITDLHGNSITTKTVTVSVSPALKILEQPKNSKTPIGKTVTVSVKAQGEALRYCWYVKDVGAASFQKTSVTTSSYKWTAAKNTSGRQVYCLITDAYGNQVKTNTVTLNAFTQLAITKQPTHIGVKKGKKAVTSVIATGDGLKYQWYIKNPKDKYFKKSSIKSSTYSWKMKTKYSGRQIYCVITDAYGNQIKTNVVTHKIPTQLKITKQPAEALAKIGKTASTSVLATGDGVSYRWYIKYPGASKFQATSVTSKTYSVKMSKEMIGAQAYCLVTDMFGNNIKSQTTSFAVGKANFERTLYKMKPGWIKSLKLVLNPADTVDEIIWTSSDPSVAKVNGKGIVTAVKYGTVRITARGVHTGFLATCKVKICNVKQVAITFDDGPGKYTADLLDFLKENDIRVTFFLVGNRLNSYKNTLKRMVQGGHEIGYHSWKHDFQTKLTNDRIIGDYKKSEKILKNLTGAEFTLWRTPGGARNSRVLDQISLPHILWSVDTLDWRYRSSSRTNRVIQNNAKDGAIILLHDIHKSTVTGAKKALKQMQDGDYEFLTVTELLSRYGKSPQAHKTYSRG